MANGQASIKESSSQGDRQEQEVFVSDERLADHPAKVSVGAGVTVNCGDREYLKLDIRVEMPCCPSAVDREYDRLLRWSMERLNKWLATVKRNQE